MANLYTKTGDNGVTSLIGGTRIRKSDMQVECYGTVDEAMSMLGLAYANTKEEYILTSVRAIQEKLFLLAAELASGKDGMASLRDTISEKDVAYLEQVVDTCMETTGKMTGFVIPGVDTASAALHAARTIVRRAERRLVELSGIRPVRGLLIRYVNRLSDAIYALARLQEETQARERMREKVTGMVKDALSGYTDDLPPISLEVLKRMADRAEEKSREFGVPIVFSAVDSGGNLMFLERMEGALQGSIEVSAGKAYTANAFRMPTHELGQAAHPGGSLYGIENAAPGKVILFGGGFPYRSGGQVTGGIGVSGGTVEQDMEIARFAMSM